MVSGQGLELVITLGTGFGTGVFYEGQMMPHLEISHQPFRKGETYNDQLGEVTRKEIGEERWNKRVHKAIVNLRAMMFFDQLYIGGGNSRLLCDPPPSRRRCDDRRQQRGHPRWDQAVEPQDHLTVNKVSG